MIKTKTKKCELKQRSEMRINIKDCILRNRIENFSTKSKSLCKEENCRIEAAT